jgi:hypothetical protein
MPGHLVVTVLQVMTLLGSALTATMLYRSGLYRRYRMFFWYFVFRIPNSSWPLFLSVKSPAYFYLWVVTEPLFWVLQILVLRELIRLVFERHRGLYTLGRWAMYLGVIVSASLSVLSLTLKFQPGTAQHSRVISYFYGTGRGVNLCLALFLILMTLFISRYPVFLGRNIILHLVLFTAFFLGNSLTDLLRSVLGIHLFTAIDIGLMALAAACTFGWFFFLTPKGEEVEVNLPRLSSDREERILYHLDSLNATLLKVSRK